MKSLLLLLLFGALVGQGQTLRLSVPVGVDTAQLGEVTRLGQHVQLAPLPPCPR
jgi:hypothetical protein